MRLKKGDPAKLFEVEDYAGKQIRLKDFAGQKCYLAFNRYASCPLCNLHIHNLIEHYELFQAKGLAILAFFESPSENIKRYVGKQQPPFPLIPDPERKVYALYGVESSWDKYARAGLHPRRLLKAFKLGLSLGIVPGKMEGDYAIVPADFLLTDDQFIAVAQYGKDIGDHIPMQTIKEFLETR